MSVVVARLEVDDAAEFVDRVTTAEGALVAQRTTWRPPCHIVVLVWSNLEAALKAALLGAEMHASSARFGIATEQALEGVTLAHESRARRRAFGLLRSSLPGQVTIDEETYAAMRDRLVASPSRPVGSRGERPPVRAFTVQRFLEQPAPSPPSDAARRGLPTLESILTLAGAIAGLAAWTAVVGGATMWARFQAAEVSPREGVAALPREVLMTEGIRTVFLPLLLGAFAALLAYAIGRALGRASDRVPEVLPDRFEDARVAAVLVSLVAGIAVVLWQLPKVELGHFGLMFAATLLAVGLAALIAWDTESRTRLAVVFVAVAAWGAVLAYLLEDGRKVPRLESASVIRENGERLDGLFVARTGEAVLVTARDERTDECRIVVVPVDDVREVQIGAISGEEPTCGRLRSESGPPVEEGGEEGETEGGDDTGGGEDESTTVTETITVTETVTERTSRIESRPAGAISLPNGLYSIPIWSVSLPHRLVISAVRFEPSPFTPADKSVTAEFIVTDTRGYRVRGALVWIRGLVYGHFKPVAEKPTDQAGAASITLRPTENLTFRRNGRVAIFLRARKPGERILSGVSVRRLVQLNLDV